MSEPCTDCRKWSIRLGAAVFLLVFAWQGLGLLLVFMHRDELPAGLHGGPNVPFSIFFGVGISATMAALAGLIFYVLCTNRRPSATPIEPVVLPTSERRFDWGPIGVGLFVALMVLFAGVLAGLDPAYFLHLSPILGTIVPSVFALGFVARRIGLPEAARRLAALPLHLGVAMVTIGTIVVLANLGGYIEDLGRGVATALTALIFSSILSVIFLVIAASEPKP